MAWRHISVQNTSMQEKGKNALKLKLQLLVVKGFSNILEERNHGHSLFVHLLIVYVCEIHVASAPFLLSAFFYAVSIS